MTGIKCEVKEIPVLKAEKVNDGMWRVWCPFCNIYHTHGSVEGHRASHCSGNTPFSHTGYIISLNPSRVAKKEKEISGSIHKVSQVPYRYRQTKYLGNKSVKSLTMPEYIAIGKAFINISNLLINIIENTHGFGTQYYTKPLVDAFDKIDIVRTRIEDAMYRYLPDTASSDVFYRHEKWIKSKNDEINEWVATLTNSKSKNDLVSGMIEEGYNSIQIMGIVRLILSIFPDIFDQ